MGGERPNEAASAAEDPISEHRNHVSDAARVKAVCWRGSPDPLQRPRSARLLGEGLAGSFKRSRSLCGRSHRSGRRNRPQRWSSSRLCRVDPALVQRGRSGGAAAPPEHTECCGRCWRAEKGLHHWGGRRRDRSCARVRLLRLIVRVSSPLAPPTVFVSIQFKWLGWGGRSPFLFFVWGHWVGL